MRSGPHLPSSMTIRISFLLAFMLLAQDAPAALASSSGQGSSNNTFWLSISQSKDPICVGDAVNVAISWGPNADLAQTEKGGLAPLYPLVGPSRIKLQASRGYFYPDPPPVPGSSSGTMTVTYIAENEGNEKIFAQAWQAGESDAIATDVFTIKTCEFHFVLDAQFNLGVNTEGLAYTVRYTVKARGTLTAPDPKNQPLHLEGKANVVKLDAVVTSWSSSKCTLFTYEPGKGMGYVDAVADPGPMGIGMTLQLAPPTDLAWDVDLSLACDGNPETLAFVYPIPSNDPWIQATFLSGSETQTIKLDMFEIPYKKLVGAPDVDVSYTATITLEKKAPK